jgi:hypothetical protein
LLAPSSLLVPWKIFLCSSLGKSILFANHKVEASALFTSPWKKQSLPMC